MKRNPASDAARQAFAAMFAKLMLDGANPKGEQRKRWTDEALAEALDHIKTKRTDKNVAPNSIGNWRKAKFLPIDVEPLIAVFFGAPPTDRKAAEALRRAYKKAQAEKIRQDERQAPPVRAPRLDAGAVLALGRRQDDALPHVAGRG